MVRRTARIWVLPLLVGCVLVGCTSMPTSRIGVSPHPSGTDASGPDGYGLPSDQGPFADLTWHPRSIEPGSLLHDDGVHLWAYSGSGRRSLVWTHPRAAVYELSADVDAKTIAMVVGSVAVQGAYLYLLEPDGSVRAIRRVSHGWDIWVPIFAKAPTEPHGATRIYWTEHSPGRFDPATDTPVMRAMTFDGSSVAPVRIPLLWGQAPWRLDSYPGNTTMSLTAFRRSNTPAFHEVLRNEDLISGGSASSPMVLGYWQQIADTDSEAGVAWLSPNAYVFQVGKSPAGDGSIPRSSLVSFDVGCEFMGGRTIWSGTTLDPGTFHSYSILAPDDSHVLVLRQAAGSSSAGPVRGWISVDVRTGRTSPSPIQWSHGPWAAVREPARGTSEGPACA